MTDITTTTTTTGARPAGDGTVAGGIHPAIDAFLAHVAAGTEMEPGLFAADVRFDGTTPGWRHHLRGPAALIRQYKSWFADPATFDELRRIPTTTGEVLVYYHSWTDAEGRPMAAHHCHVLDLDEAGRIATDTFFCGGRWGAETLARIELGL